MNSSLLPDLRAALALAQREYDSLALASTQGQDVEKKLTQVHGEIEEFKAGIGRLEAAERAAAVRGQQEQDALALQRLEDAKAAAVQSAQAIAPIVARMEKAIAELAAAFNEYETRAALTRDMVIQAGMALGKLVPSAAQYALQAAATTSAHAQGANLMMPLLAHLHGALDGRAILHGGVKVSGYMALADHRKMTLADAARSDAEAIATRMLGWRPELLSEAVRPKQTEPDDQRAHPQPRGFAATATESDLAVINTAGEA